MKTLFQQANDAGIEHDSHCSDLYLPVTDETKAMIADYEFKGNVTIFTSEIDGTLWYDIPFAFDPFWAKCDECVKLLSFKRYNNETSTRRA